MLFQRLFKPGKKMNYTENTEVWSLGHLDCKDFASLHGNSSGEGIQQMCDIHKKFNSTGDSVLSSLYFIPICLQFFLLFHV